MNTSELQRLQHVELDILKQAIAICDRHGLTYYMLGGTLLGAVRHHGFIPWDNDIDIGMPRPDYEKFLSYAKQELQSPYHLRTIEDSRAEYVYYYARLENQDVKLLRSLSVKQVLISAWLDVFPLDGVPNDPQEKKEWEKRCFRSKQYFIMAQFPYYATPEDPKKKKPFSHKIARFLFLHFHLHRLISTRWAWERLDSALKSSHYESCDSLINYCGAWGFKEMFPKSVYGSGRLYPFEDLMLNGPEDYDTVLSQMYGDYMTPPPENKRSRHSVEFAAEQSILEK